MASGSSEPAGLESCCSLGLGVVCLPQSDRGLPWSEHVSLIKITGLHSSVYKCFPVHTPQLRDVQKPFHVSTS